MEKIKDADRSSWPTSGLPSPACPGTPVTTAATSCTGGCAKRGYEVFAVNPNADEVEGDVCHHDLKSIPDGVDAVVIATRPETAEATMRECDELGIAHVWMHRSFGTGSVSKAAAGLRPAARIKVIDGGCPLMFAPTADTGHRVMRVMCTLAGNVPRRV